MPMDNKNSTMLDGAGSGKWSKPLNPNAPAFFPSTYTQANTMNQNSKQGKQNKTPRPYKSARQSKASLQKTPSFQEASGSQEVQSQDTLDSTTKSNSPSKSSNNSSWLNVNAPEFVPRQFTQSNYISHAPIGAKDDYLYYQYQYQYQQHVLMNPHLPTQQLYRIPPGNMMADQFTYLPPNSTTLPPPDYHYTLPVDRSMVTVTNNDINNSMAEMSIRPPEPPKQEEIPHPHPPTSGDSNDKTEVHPEERSANLGSHPPPLSEEGSLDKGPASLDQGPTLKSDLPQNTEQEGAGVPPALESETTSSQHSLIKSEVEKEAQSTSREDVNLALALDSQWGVVDLITVGAYLYKQNLITIPFKFVDAKSNYKTKEKKHRDESRGKHEDHENKKLSGFFSYERYNDIDFVRPVQEQLPKPSETSWVSKQKLQKADDTTNLIRKVKSLLNRLTYEKFDIIYEQLINVGIFTMDHLRILIDVVFYKAVTQHHFISMYAELCSKIKKDIVIKGEAVDDSEKNNVVRRLLLDKCQNFFESNLNPMVLPPQLNEEEFFEAEQKYKHQMRGNMMFVGELLKRKILAAKVLIACLDQVMLKREECIADGNIDLGNNHLEAMCTLLQTVGKSFDTCKWKHLPDLDKHLESLKVIGSDERVSFRIRCIIKNVLDSRNDKWEDRGLSKIAEIPCKLDELRSKIQAESERSDRPKTARLDKDSQKSSRAVRLDRSKSSKADLKVSEPPPPPMPREQLRKKLNGIVSELVFSSNVQEANECFAELQLPPDAMQNACLLLLTGIIEKCAKVTMHRERKVALSWFMTIAGAAFQSTIDKFLSRKGDDELNYLYLLEDYPILPTIMDELFTYSKDSGAVGDRIILSWREMLRG